MGGKSSQEKGGRGQREVAKLLRDIWPGTHSGYWQHTGGDRCCDVEGTPFFVEVKFSDCSPEAALRQAIAACGEREPVAFTRDVRQPWIVTMRLATMRYLFREHHDQMREVERLRHVSTRRTLVEAQTSATMVTFGGTASVWASWWLAAIKARS